MKRRPCLAWLIVALTTVWATASCYPSRASAAVTTVLLLRHAERDDGSLSGDGLERADELVHVLAKAGVTAIYTTDTERTKQTVQPLADRLRLEPRIYQVGSPDQIADLAARLQRDHHGGVVLVVGHNPTLPQIIDALGGDSTDCSIGAAYDDFDDLCVVTMYGPSAVSVLNLQYGRATP